MSSANDSMLEMFLFEMSSLLDQLDEILLTSEKNQALTPDEVNEIFRIMHTIKGSSAMMEFEVISHVTHKLEDTFYYIRENGIEQQFFTPLFDVMLEASDFLKSQLEAIQNGTELSAGNDDLVNRVHGVLEMINGTAPETEAATGAPAQEQAPAPSASEPEPDAKSEPPAGTDTPTQAPAGPVQQPQAGYGALYGVEVWFDEDCGMENLRAFMLITTLRASCNIISFDPADIETNPETSSHILVNGFFIELETELDQDHLQEIIEQSMHVKSAAIVPMEREQAAADESPELTVGEVYEVFVRFEDDCGMENLRAFMLINSLRQNARIIGFSPSDIESNSDSAVEIAQNGFAITLQTALSAGELQNMFGPALHVKSAKITRAAGSPGAAAPPAAAQAQVPAVSAPTETAAPAQAPAKAEPAAGSPAAAEAQPSSGSGAPPQVAVPAAQANIKPAAVSGPRPPQAAPSGPPQFEAPAPPPVAAANKPVKQNLINVSLSKLDDLMDIMGEIVITESMVIHSPDLKGVTDLDNFHKSARQLRKLTDELQDIVMSVRMIPISGTFQKMQRIVRDMCRNLGKEANLVTMGEDTDIDKTIIDGIADPIMHLVRNSMDHGVETPEEREAAGKPSKATITLSAQNTGGEILITVSDDGKGLDAEKLLNKAKQNGILTKPAGEYTEKEAFMLLCAPGFSTKEEVTEYSGRGVGLDVVKKNIEKIGGTVVIESKKGYGMSVFLKIPLTLAIVDGMDVTVGGGLYTLQITSINESFKATRDRVITDTVGNEMIIIRGDVYPIIRLHELFNVPNAITNIEDGILIWVQAGDESACLFVDELLGEQQIVVKPLPSYLNRYDAKSYGISGCTILGDGNISLILDVGGIIQKKMETR